MIRNIVCARKMTVMTGMFAPTFFCYKPFSSPLSSFTTSHPFSSSSINHTFPSFSLSATGTTCSPTWDDVFRISKSETAIEEDPSSYLQGFFHKVQLCNRASDKQSEFVPFIVEGLDVGFIHNRFVEHLRGFNDVFVFPNDGGPLGYYVILHPLLKTAEERTSAVGYVVKQLGEEHIPGIRNELYPVKSSFSTPAFFSLERAAAPYFGIKPHGIGCLENVVKECEEEAGIPRSISIKAKSVSVVSYKDIEGYRYKRDVLFCYDLTLPENFVPNNIDGEVESFKLIPVEQVAEVIRRTQFFKPNCAIVIIDFLFRHGYISLENDGYLDLLKSLRIGDWS
ncbi:hypothetical protein RYX36_008074 [Vicia faba]